MTHKEGASQIGESGWRSDVRSLTNLFSR